MRGKRSPKKLAPADPVYGNRQLTKLINRVMVSGKKSLAQKHVYQALKLVKTKTKKDPLEVFESAITQITPKMKVRSRRVGGASYQVPIPVKASRGFSLAVRWLVTEAQKRPNKQHPTFAEKLAAEMIDASQGQGGAINQKITAHRQADANKAFSHFRW